MCSLGRGTSAACRCMNANGLITRCEVPSRHGTAHEVCPYSNATRGNIDVTLTVF